MSKVEYKGTHRMLEPRSNYNVPLDDGNSGVKGTVTTKRTPEGIQIVSSDMNPSTQTDNLPTRQNK